MSGERLLDELARTLATPMPRRRALRLMGMALAAAAVPALRPPSASARATVNCAAKVDTPVPCSCPAAGGLTFENCCWDKRACNCHPTSANCCPKPTTWDGQQCVEACPANRVKCGGECCGPGLKCCPPTRQMPKARCYDPRKECCTPVAGIVPKWPIRNVQDCPNRVARKNHKPRANGCGPENGVKVPDRPFVADFKPACDYHDICYETCGRSKAFCDRRFRELMEDACDESFGPGARRLACYGAAGTYYQFVSRLGDDPYEEAQKTAPVLLTSASLAFALVLGLIFAVAGSAKLLARGSSVAAGRSAGSPSGP